MQTSPPTGEIQKWIALIGGEGLWTLIKKTAAIFLATVSCFYRYKRLRLSAAMRVGGWFSCNTTR
jgi:hypothetical protein